MGTYVVTGAASGMGHAVVERLRHAGHTVLTVDLHDADVEADLATDEGRRTAAAEVLARADGRLDGAVLAAGLGPVPGREEAPTSATVRAPGRGSCASWAGTAPRSPTARPSSR